MEELVVPYPSISLTCLTGPSFQYPWMSCTKIQKKKLKQQVCERQGGQSRSRSNRSSGVFESLRIIPSFSHIFPIDNAWNES
jgi:hypothetical protein